MKYVIQDKIYGNVIHTGKTLEEVKSLLASCFISDLYEIIEVTTDEDKPALKKVIRDGKVAVLYSPDYGSGWYTWNKECPQCVFSPEIVELVENNERDEITEELCKKLFECEHFYVSSNASELEIVWLPQGTEFIINEYDGNESIKTLEQLELFTA